VDALRTLLEVTQAAVGRRSVGGDNASQTARPTRCAALSGGAPDRQPGHLGFAGGNNLALRAIGFGSQPQEALPHAVFLLNPDTLVQEGAVRALYDTLFADERNGLVGARLAYGDGRFQHSAFAFPGIWQTLFDLLPMPGRFYESALNGRYPRTLYDGVRPFPVDHTLGATMMLRREVIQQTGMFDEQFFMYCEEVDWAMRIRKAGWRICAFLRSHHPSGRADHIPDSPGQRRQSWRRVQVYTKHYSRSRCGHSWDRAAGDAAQDRPGPAGFAPRRDAAGRADRCLPDGGGAMTTLAAIILCRDELDHLPACIESAAFADETIVFVDAGSPVLAQVIAAAEAAGARTCQRRFDDYASQRNAALDSTAAEWVLFIDVDERVTPGLAAEVRRVIAAPDAVGYGIPRHNYIFGHLTRHTGWYPDYQTRLLHRASARYDPARPVHEVVILDGPQGYLQEPFIHYNYRDLAHFVAKQRLRGY
jgi:GT2 family glycosyltransferase